MIGIFQVSLRFKLVIGGLILFLLVACQSQPEQIQEADSGSNIVITTATPGDVADTKQDLSVPSKLPDPLGSGEDSPALGEARPSTRHIYAYTNQRPDGNRIVSGTGSLPQASHFDIPLRGIPQWIVGGLPDDESDALSTVWAVVLADGQAQAFLLKDGEAIEISIDPTFFGSRPPVLELAGSQPRLLIPPETDAALGTPVILDESGYLAAISNGGELQIIDSTGNITILPEIRPLPDARLLTDGEGRLLFLADPTNRYNHGVLADEVEAAAIVMVDTQPEPEVLLNIQVPEPAVIEGIAPLWVDLDGDGQREIIVTQSDVQQGAQIVVYDESGARLATGPAIGLGYRWRHQIAAGLFGPAGELELVDVLTPHIGGIVEFYRLEDNQLKIVAEEPGFTSHIIGTRNLDMALAGDVDGDGKVELLLPNQARTELGAIRRTDDGAEVAWTVPMDGRIITNLAAIQIANGQLAIGVGREDGVLRIWYP